MAYENNRFKMIKRVCFYRFYAVITRKSGTYQEPIDCNVFQHCEIKYSSVLMLKTPEQASTAPLQRPPPRRVNFTLKGMSTRPAPPCTPTVGLGAAVTSNSGLGFPSSMSADTAAPQRPPFHHRLTALNARPVEDYDLHVGTPAAPAGE